MNKKHTIPPLSRDELIWIAGYIEGKGFGVHVRSRQSKSGKHSYKHYGANITISATGKSKQSGFNRLLKLIKRKTYTITHHNTFAEKFFAGHRPAQYMDGLAATSILVIETGEAQKLIKQLSPFLTSDTLQRLNPVINYKLDRTRRDELGRYTFR